MGMVSMSSQEFSRLDVLIDLSAGRITVEDAALEEASGVSAAIIRRIESFDGISEAVGAALSKLKTALHDAGADFISSYGQPGRACGLGGKQRDSLF